MLLPARCERVATSLNRTVSGDTFPTLSSLDKPVGRSILHELFDMGKVFAKMVPKLPTPEQEESRTNICADNIGTDPGLLDTVITCDDKIRKCGSG
ncbi:hypothetical protein NQ318_010246 [Aromia moschata]|uniref:Uncharacterized protein n=1 Tax=Aromia moschata TaxID=1265417 RepID=A0AAV8YIH7_9CUCU|nr:hypothetical protein NQ318_010246 [Aromia moschata]